MNEAVKTLISQSEQIAGIDLDGAIENSQKAVDLSRKNKFSRELIVSLVQYASFLSEKGESLIVLDSIFEALSLAKKSDREDILLLCQTALGTIYMRQGDLEKAFTAYNNALDLGNSMKEECDLSEVYFGLGTILSYKQNDRDAIEYFEKGQEIAREFDNVKIQLKILNNLGCSWHYLDDHVKAERYLLECIERSRKENNYQVLVYALDELGTIYNKKGDKRALDAWQEALGLSEKRGSSFITIGPLLSLATYYYEKEDWGNADSFLQRAKKLSDKSGSTFDLADLYKLETKFHESRGNFKAALDSHRKYLELWKEVQKQESIWELKNRELELLTETRDRIVTLSDIGRIITSTLDLELVLSRSYSNLKKILDFSILGIARFNGETSEISYELFMEDGEMHPRFTSSLDDPNSLAAWSIRNEEMILISEFDREYSRYMESKKRRVGNKTGPEERIPQSVIYNPLKIGDRIIGVITIQSYKVDSFSLKDVESFDVFSSYAAIALNNAIQAAEITKQNDVLSSLATTDSLTGLHNRRYFFDMLGKYYSIARRRDLPLSLIMLDLDHFKNVNDSYGHPAGDAVLQVIGEILRRYVKRSHDCAARLGGEEFGIFLGDSDHGGALLMAEKIRKEIEEYEFSFGGRSLSVTASLGVTTNLMNKNTDLSPDILVRRTDVMLYAAKEGGRNCVKSREFF